MMIHSVTRNIRIMPEVTPLVEIRKDNPDILLSDLNMPGKVLLRVAFAGSRKLSIYPTDCHDKGRGIRPLSSIIDSLPRPEP